jgi:hypothetical protein
MNRKLRRQRDAKHHAQMRKLNASCDIQVESKGFAVFIMANARGRPIVEQCFPDVQWSPSARCPTRRSDQAANRNVFLAAKGRDNLKTLGIYLSSRVRVSGLMD